MAQISISTEESERPFVVTDDRSGAQLIDRIVLEHARTLRHTRARRRVALQEHRQRFKLQDC
jgi:hypothetical protein